MIARTATPDDLDAAVDVLRQVAEEGGLIATEPPVDVQGRALAMRTMLHNTDEDIYVLEDAGRIIGLAGLHRTGAAGVGALGISILREHRGRGGGRLLLDAVLEGAQRAGLARLELDVYPDNATAIALYERAGFERVGIRRQHLQRRDGSRRDVLLMGLVLPVSQ